MPAADLLAQIVALALAMAPDDALLAEVARRAPDAPRAAEPDTAAVREHLDHAIRILGSQGRLAVACGVSQAAICKAAKAGRVSARLAQRIDSATLGAVPKGDLCPDVFGPAGFRAMRPITPLCAYMRDRKLTNEDLARIVGGISANGIRKLRYGERGPSVRVAARLATISGGRLSAADLLPRDA